MPRAAPGKPNDAIPALPAVGRRPAAQMHRRRSITADCGRYVRLTHAEQLQALRQRCAASENIQTLRRVAEDAEELGWVAPKLCGEIDALVARLHQKIERITPAAPGEKRKRQAARVNVADSRTISPMIEMKIGAWEIDEHGNKSRCVWNSEGLPP
jgi:hypothetical protein